MKYILPLEPKKSTVAQGGDSCNIDGKTFAFHVRLSGFKRSFEFWWF